MLTTFSMSRTEAFCCLGYLQRTFQFVFLIGTGSDVVASLLAARTGSDSARELLLSASHPNLWTTRRPLNNGRQNLLGLNIVHVDRNDPACINHLKGLDTPLFDAERQNIDPSCEHRRTRIGECTPEVLEHLAGALAGSKSTTFADPPSTRDSTWYVCPNRWTASSLLPSSELRPMHAKVFGSMSLGLRPANSALLPRTARSLCSSSRGRNEEEGISAAQAAMR